MRKVLPWRRLYIATSQYLNIHPWKLKKSITGNGSASKEQVAAMLNRLLTFDKNPETLDATDGLAAAMCHYFKRTKGIKGKTYAGWKNFLADNPDRIKK